MPDITKLPKWAQEEIRTRDVLIERLETQVKNLSIQHPGTNVVVSGGFRKNDVTLPHNSRIRFYMEPESEEPGTYNLRSALDVYHDRSAYGEELYIAADGGRLTVLPSASNSVRLRIDKR